MSLSRRQFSAGLAGQVAGLAAAFAGGRALAGQGADVLRVRLGGDRGHARLVIDATGPARSQAVEPGPGPATLAVRIAGLAAPAMKGQGRGLIDRWSLAPASSGDLRLLVTLAEPAQIERIFPLAPGDGVAHWRLVVDLTPAPPLRIVIDAGHGGDDVGARGAVSFEKNVTLAHALALGESLAADRRYAVSMTRAEDRFVPLDRRRAAATGADLFLSLHADASSDPTVCGASAYSISDRGVSRAIALLDGRAMDEDPATSGLLLDLRQRGLRNRSAAFAEHLLACAAAEAPLLRRGHREAGFAVLLGLETPAILFEMGFMTNREDEARLNNPARQARLAACVKQAIDGRLAIGPFVTGRS